MMKDVYMKIKNKKISGEEYLDEIQVSTVIKNDFE